MRGPCLGCSRWVRRGQMAPLVLSPKAAGVRSVPPSEMAVPDPQQRTLSPGLLRAQTAPMPLCPHKTAGLPSLSGSPRGWGPHRRKKAYPGHFKEILGDGALEQRPALSRCLGDASLCPRLSQPCFHLVTSGAGRGWATLGAWGALGVSFILPLSQPLARMPPAPSPQPRHHQQVEEAGGTRACPSDPLCALKGVDQA